MGSLAPELDHGPEPEATESPAKYNTQPTPTTISNDKKKTPELLLNKESAELHTSPPPPELELESAALDRHKHTLRGMAIYESTIKEHKGKTEANSLMDAVTKLDKCNNFVVQLIDISLQGEALGTRLKEGTNRKRARTINLELLKNHNHLLNLVSTQEHDDGCRTARARSEEIDTEACARARSRQFQGETEPKAEEGHNGDDMSERSSGTKRRTRSSLASTTEDPADIPAGADTSSTLEEEIPESADQNVGRFSISPRAEVEVGKAVVESSARLQIDSNTANITTSQSGYIRGSAKRIRPNQGPKVVEKESKELKAKDSPEKEIDAFSTTDAHDQKAVTASSAAPETKRKTWTARARYFDHTKTSFPEYGPCAPVRKTPREADEEMPNPMNYGAPRPVNRLAGSSKPNPNPPYKSHRPGMPKPFDLTSDESRGRRRDEHPAKRQRVDNGSSTSPIDVDRQSSYNSKYSGPSSTRSGHSQTLPGRDGSAIFGTRDASLQEARNVDKSMKPPRSRNRNGATDNNIPVINGSQRFNRDSFDQNAREDKNDRISDDEITITETGPPRKPNNKVEVQIPAYEGSAFRKSPRQKANGNRRISNSLPMEIASPYFPSDPASSQDQRDSREKKQVDRTNSRVKEDHSLLSQNDRDELSLDQYGNTEHANTAQRLLRESQPIKRGEEESQDSPIHVEDLSEDEISKNPDIIPVNYGASKSKPRNIHEEESYTVHQVLSAKVKWLSPDKMSYWTMALNKSESLLSFYDAFNKLVLEFPSHEIESVEVADPGNLIVFHRSRAQTAAGAIRIYIQMHNSHDCQRLFESLHSLDHTLKQIPKPQDHLRRVFDHIDQMPPHVKRQSQEPDDIRLAKAKSEKRLGAKWAGVQSAKKASANANGMSQRDGHIERGSRSKGVAKNMRGRSLSVDLLGAEEIQKTSTAAAFSPEGYYGTSGNSTKPNRADSHGTRSSGRITTQTDSPYVSRVKSRQRPRSPSPEPERWTFQNPDWVTEENWRSSVIYPPDEKNQATVDMQDIQRLDEGEFLNDNLVVFYLRWLESRLGKERPELASRIYFTNTFFYERLTKNAKGKFGGINYEAVERWTAKIDLLKYDYIVVPVNETVHWYVAIICNAPKLLKQLPSEEATSQDAKSGDAGDELNKVEAEGQPIPSPLKSPSKTLPDEVNTEMKQMTLEDDTTDEKSHVDAPPTVLGFSGPTKNQKDLEMVDLDLPPAKVVSDVVEQQPVQSKKGKRKSTPAPRRYNPDEPRIITLDSLGLTHSPTCTNLRKYLLQEIKAKKNIDIVDPGPLGTTAKNIPLQNNHCDCGLFLLTYMEEFLERPDEFIHDLLQQNEQDFRRWRSASDMRKRIRNLLFDLQREQARDAEVSRKEKAKGKQAAKADEKSSSASSSKPASREATKSARGSPEPEKVQHMPEANESRSEKSKKRQEAPAPSVELLDKVGVDARVEAGLSNSNAVESHGDEVRGDSRKTPSMLTRLIAKAQSKINHVLGLEENGLGGGPPNTKATESQPITIDDSQDLDGNEEYAEAAPTHASKSSKRKASFTLQESSRRSKHSHPENTVEIPESPTKPTSRKASSDDVTLNPHPLIHSNQGEEQEQHRSHRSTKRRAKDSEHRSSGKAKVTDNIGPRQDAEEWDGFDAIPSHNDDVQLVDPNPKRLHNGVVADSQQDDDDDEMLLQGTPRTGPPSVRFLSSSPPVVASKPVSTAANRSWGKTTPSSPSDTKRTSSHIAENGPASPKRRKIVVDLAREHPSPEAKQRGRPARAQLRDSSDLAIIGSKGNNIQI
ncbi:hypothetical protein IFR05_007296 [Cadophora sp. M221]|nr:hypothetical protein IFR05_007296 [Cadophora sp. M221]